MKCIVSGFLLLFVMLVLHACSPVPMQKKIMGAWLVDSIYYYNNGFDYTDRSPSTKEQFYYRPDSTVIHEGMGSQLLFYYQLNDSLLFYYDRNKTLVANYSILHLDEVNMVLKREKRPHFEGRNQVKYEVRYFSKNGPVSTTGHPL